MHFDYRQDRLDLVGAQLKASLKLLGGEIGGQLVPGVDRKHGLVLRDSSSYLRVHLDTDGRIDRVFLPLPSSTKRDDNPSDRLRMDFRDPAVARRINAPPDWGAGQFVRAD